MKHLKITTTPLRILRWLKSQKKKPPENYIQYLEETPTLKKEIINFFYEGATKTEAINMFRQQYLSKESFDDEFVYYAMILRRMLEVFVSMKDPANFKVKLLERIVREDELNGVKPKNVLVRPWVSRTFGVKNTISQPEKWHTYVCVWDYLLHSVKTDVDQIFKNIQKKSNEKDDFYGFKKNKYVTIDTIVSDVVLFDSRKRKLSELIGYVDTQNDPSMVRRKRAKLENEDKFDDMSKKINTNEGILSQNLDAIGALDVSIRTFEKIPLLTPMLENSRDERKKLKVSLEDTLHETNTLNKEFSKMMGDYTDKYNNNDKYSKCNCCGKFSSRLDMIPELCNCEGSHVFCINCVSKVFEIGKCPCCNYVFPKDLPIKDLLLL